MSLFQAVLVSLMATTLTGCSTYTLQEIPQPNQWFHGTPGIYEIKALDEGGSETMGAYVASDHIELIRSDDQCWPCIGGDYYSDHAQVAEARFKMRIGPNFGVVRLRSVAATSVYLGSYSALAILAKWDAVSDSLKLDSLDLLLDQDRDWHDPYSSIRSEYFLPTTNDSVHISLLPILPEWALPDGSIAHDVIVGPSLPHADTLADGTILTISDVVFARYKGWMEAKLLARMPDGSVQNVRLTRVLPRD